MNALKCQIVVTAGIIIDEPIPAYSKVFSLTSADLELPSGNAMYNALVRSANEYAVCLMAPKQLNWVRCEWVWM